MKHLKGMEIRAEDIHFSYESALTGDFALQGVSFVLPPGECVALAGASGSGKSTLAQLLNGLLWPRRGRLLVQGWPVINKPAALRELRRQVALVFQFPEAQIFEQTVLDEVAFAARRQGVPESEIPALVENAIQAVGLNPEDFLGRNPLKLSGGEARLVTIASLLVVEPAWLILDEPTLGLDFLHTRHIRDIIKRRRAARRGTLLITHDLALALEICPRILVLQCGRLVYDGRTTDLFLQPELVKKCDLADPEVINLWRLLKSELPDLPCLDENALISTITELAPAKKEMVAQLLRQHLERLQLIQD